jgi:hypothetical protein
MFCVIFLLMKSVSCCIFGYVAATLSEDGVPNREPYSPRQVKNKKATFGQIILFQGVPTGGSARLRNWLLMPQASWLGRRRSTAQSLAPGSR